MTDLDVREDEYRYTFQKAKLKVFNESFQAFQIPKITYKMFSEKTVSAFSDESISQKLHLKRRKNCSEKLFYEFIFLLFSI